MLNFAEQTGSGAVIVVWSFLIVSEIVSYLNATQFCCQMSPRHVGLLCSLAWLLQWLPGASHAPPPTTTTATHTLTDHQWLASWQASVHQLAS
jgi:hypothetical protein